MAEIDGRCSCELCTNRTLATYRLTATCGNCGEHHTILLRKGDRPNRLQECPTCGVSRLNYGSLFKEREG